MPLNSAKLIDKLDEKAKLHLGADYNTISGVMKEKFFKVIAEAVVEHIKENAEVKVIITGKDGGAAISGNYLNRFLTRGDTAVPGGATRNNTTYPPLSPMSGIQTTTDLGLATDSSTSTKILNTPGFID